MHEKYTVSIGIPAYNEEANIHHLLQSLLKQKQNSFVLSEIIVVSDGSDDATEALVKSIQDPRIQLIPHTDRKGQSVRQNEILEKFSGDILVLLNADILPKSDDFLEKFIAPFQKNQRIGLVGARGVPLKPRTLVERIINHSVYMKDYMFASWNGGVNIYTCHGHSRALHKSFAKQLTWPVVMAEDSYSYLMCKNLGFEYAYAEQAEINFRTPQTLRDHLKQSVRFVHSKDELKSMFTPKLIETEFAIPRPIFFASLLKYFIKNPALFLGYIGIQVFARFNPYKQKSSAVWETSRSSKSLVD